MIGDNEMNEDALDKLIQLWQDDQDFRRAVQKDPEAAIAAQGIQLSDEVREALKALDGRGTADQEIDVRLSK